MDKQRILITGGSGFLGSAVMDRLVNSNYKVMATKRSHTDLFRCEDFKDQVKWVDSTDVDYKDEAIAFKPNVILHAAWSGVSSKERADWSIQIKNFELLNDILEIAGKVKLTKLLMLGSQAEYGTIHTKVGENYPVNGRDAYAICKQASQKIVETFCEQSGIDWYWLRVFSVFGAGEAPNWFIPWVITNQLNQIDSDLTLCEQHYDYLYINDFVNMVTSIIEKDDAPSGVYNICSGETIKLKTIVEQIVTSINGGGRVNFGAIPYRENQSMVISGDNSKYNATFDVVKKTDLESAILQTIAYYKNIHGKQA